MAIEWNAIMDERKKEVADINAYGGRSWTFCRVPLRGHEQSGGSTQCRACYKEKGRAGEGMVKREMCRVRVLML